MSGVNSTIILEALVLGGSMGRTSGFYLTIRNHSSNGDTSGHTITGGG